MGGGVLRRQSRGVGDAGQLKPHAALATAPQHALPHLVPDRAIFLGAGVSHARPRESPLCSGNQSAPRADLPEDLNSGLLLAGPGSVLYCSPNTTSTASVNPGKISPPLSVSPATSRSI